MTRKELILQIKSKRSFLCVGLDSDINKIPKHLLDLEDPIFEFNKQIINATKDLCVAYKPNIAFYESMGVSGWESLKKTLDYIPEDFLIIADAKRGDIGNTASMYAKTFFEYLDIDDETVAPYMGSDSVIPFLDFRDRNAYFEDVKSFNSDYLFHLGAYTDLEFCEENVDDTYNTNTLENFTGMFRYSEVLKTIDDADTSILSNITKVKMYKYITPTLASALKYTLSFNNAFYNPHTEHNKSGGGIVSSTGFKINDDSSTNEHFLDDDGNGNIRVYYLSGTTRIYTS